MRSIMDSREILSFLLERDMRIIRRSKGSSILWMKES